MSARRRRAHIRPRLGALVLALLWPTGATAAEARADGAIPPTPFPAPVLSVGLSADTPLPDDAVPWTTLSAPPAHGEAGGMLQPGGGGGPRLRYYGLDALGSVRVVFDSAGQVVSRADYEPFGAAAATTTGPQPREQYTGHERDGEVGVDYFGARLYLALLGRFLSVDPAPPQSLDRPQRFNRYVYASNRPTSVIDPDGRGDICSASHAECDLGTAKPPVDRAGGDTGGGGSGGSEFNTAPESWEWRMPDNPFYNYSPSYGDDDGTGCLNPRNCEAGGGQGGHGLLFPTLPARTERTLREALSRVANMTPSAACTADVLSKLPAAIGTSPGAKAGGFSLKGLQERLGAC